MRAATAALLALCAAVPALVSASPMDPPYPSYPHIPGSAAPMIPDNDDPPDSPEPSLSYEPFRSYVDFALWSLEGHVEVSKLIIKAVARQQFLNAGEERCDGEHGAAVLRQLVDFYNEANKVVYGDIANQFVAGNDRSRLADDLPFITSTGNQEVYNGLKRLAKALHARLDTCFKETQANIERLLQSSFGQADADIHSLLHRLSLVDRTRGQPDVGGALPLLAEWVPRITRLNFALSVLGVTVNDSFVKHGVALMRLLDGGAQLQAEFASEKVVQYFDPELPVNPFTGLQWSALDANSQWTPGFQSLLNVLTEILVNRNSMKETYDPDYSM